MKKRVLIGLVLAGALLAVAGFDYSDYMQSLDITSSDTPVTAGGTGTVQAAVKANTDVDVHFEFKGHFAWGDYTYDSEVVQLVSVNPTMTYFPQVMLNVPFKAILDAEVGTSFYYYVYVTMPGEGWSGSAWGVMTDPVEVNPPPSSAAAIEALIAQLKWEVTNSALDDGMKTSLMAKLELANKMVAKGKYKTAYNTVGAFINELQSANAAAVYSDSESWINWIVKAQFIQSLLT